MSEQLNSILVPEYFTPHLGKDGAWGTSGALAIKESLSQGDMDGVMDVLSSMGPTEMAVILRESGFEVSPETVDKGREAVMAAAQRNLVEAMESRISGKYFSAKPVQSSEARDSASLSSATNGDAMQAIQDMLN